MSTSEKVIIHVIGTIIIAGTCAYLALPRDEKRNVREKFCSLMKKKDKAICSCLDCNCDN